MSSVEIVSPATARRESTLGELLQRTAYAQLPDNFYWLLQICAPLAFQIWGAGWHRTAGWLIVASAFGVWGIAQQHLEGHEDSGERIVPRSSLGRAWRAARLSAAAIGSFAALALILEAFVQVMARVFKCPGCAG